MRRAIARRWSRAAVVVALVVTAGSIGSSAVPAHAATGTWTYVALRPLVEGEDTFVTDINNAGVSVGASGTNAVKWDAAGNPTLLPRPAGCTAAQAASINDRGDVAGTPDCGSSEVGTIWYPDRVVKASPSMFVAGLDNADNIAGSQYSDPFHGHAVIAVKDGATQTLNDAGANASRVTDLTHTQLVVGSARFGDSGNTLGKTYAVGWYGPYVFPLINRAESTEAVAANDAGYTLVDIDPSSGSPYTVIVAPGGKVIPLTNDHEDSAVDLNANGIAVGAHIHYSTFPNVNVDPRLYVYGTAVSLYDLMADNEVDLNSPRAINDDNWVVGLAAGADATVSWLIHPPG